MRSMVQFRQKAWFSLAFPKVYSKFTLYCGLTHHVCMTLLIDLELIFLKVKKKLVSNEIDNTKRNKKKTLKCQ